MRHVNAIWPIIIRTENGFKFYPGQRLPSARRQTRNKNALVTRHGENETLFDAEDSPEEQIDPGAFTEA